MAAGAASGNPWVVAAGAVIAIFEYGKAKKSSQRQADAAAKRVAEEENFAYRALAEQERQVQEDSGEQMTERMRDARRQLAASRLLAAEGEGVAGFREKAIVTGGAEDMARIDTNRRRAISASLQQRENVRASGDSQRDAIRNKAADQMRGQTLQLAAGAINAGASYYKRQSEVELAKNKSNQRGSRR
jgi:hypothetical protein